MTKKIVAIGGGENGRILDNGEKTLYETRPMDEEIIRLTNKEKPNFLFIAHAMSVSLEIEESYYQTMKKIYGDLFGCQCKILRSTELTDFEYAKSLIDWADIIYEGGGDTSSMINLWRNNKFAQLLYEAWNNGKVICGISAGAVCWFNSCSSDSIDNNFETVDCLNWIKAFVTPHCNEIGRIESSKEQLKNNNLVGIYLSNCAAIEIIDDKYRIITSDAKGYGLEKGYCCKSYWKNGKYYEVKLKETSEFIDLRVLLEKEGF